MEQQQYSVVAAAAVDYDSVDQMGTEASRATQEKGSAGCCRRYLHAHRWEQKD